MKGKSGKKKKLVLIITAVAVTAAIGAGIFLGTRGGGEPVNVYPFQYIGMTEFWGDSQESYGPVTTDKIQTVYLSDTQTVTEILVKDGDTVKKGDVLMTFDTTLDGLSLERKRLDVEKIRLELKATEAELEKVRKMKPMEIPEETEPEVTEPELGEPMPTEAYYVTSEDKAFDGSAMEKALILWLRDGESLNNGLLRIMQQLAQEYQEYNKNKPESSASVPPAAEGVSDGADTAGSITDDSTGDKTGNVTGDESGNVTGGESGDESGNVTGGESGNVTGGEAGDESGNVTGGEAGDESGNVTGGEAGGESGNVTGGEAGGESGNVTGGEAGNESGNVTGGEAGGESGNVTGGEAGNESGNVTGGEAGDESGNVTGGETGNETGNNSGSEPPANNLLGASSITEELPKSATIEITIICDGNEVETAEKEVDSDGLTVNNAYTYDNKTYWLHSVSRGADTLLLDKIPGFPKDDAAAQAAWKEKWGALTLNYVRSTEITCPTISEGDTITLISGENLTLFFAADFENVPKNGDWKWEVTPESGESIFTETAKDRFLILSGESKTVTNEPVTYNVTATYHFPNSSLMVKKDFKFHLKVAQDTSAVTLGEYYMVLKVTEEDMERGAVLIWQGIHVYAYADGSFGFTLFDASMLEDHMLEPLEELPVIELPEIDFGSGYTAAQLSQMRTDLQKKIKETEFNLKLAEAEYKIMEREISDGHIYADIDGQVVSVLTEDEAKTARQPVVKVSGGGGFYVEGSVSELEKDNLKPGQEVTINDWNTGMTYTGEVRSIGDFPSNENGWNGLGNPNASYYPFQVFIDGTADLQEGSYVSVVYSTAEGGNGIYLENSFVRTEKGRSYVYAADANGKLEKRYVTVGKSLWGSYTEILSGLGEDDFLAFPYGKTVKEGAPTVESDLSSLYSY